MLIRRERRSESYQLPPRAVRTWEEGLARLEQGSLRQGKPIDAARLHAREQTRRLLSHAPRPAAASLDSVLPRLLERRTDGPPLPSICMRALALDAELSYARHATLGVELACGYLEGTAPLAQAGPQAPEILARLLEGSYRVDPEPLACVQAWRELLQAYRPPGPSLHNLLACSAAFEAASAGAEPTLQAECLRLTKANWRALRHDQAERLEPLVQLARDIAQLPGGRPEAQVVLVLLSLDASGWAELRATGDARAQAQARDAALGRRESGLRQLWELLRAADQRAQTGDFEGALNAVADAYDAVRSGRHTRLAEASLFGLLSQTLQRVTYEGLQVHHRHQLPRARRLLADVIALCGPRQLRVPEAVLVALAYLPEAVRGGHVLTARPVQRFQDTSRPTRPPVSASAVPERAAAGAHGGGAPPTTSPPATDLAGSRTTTSSRPAPPTEPGPHPQHQRANASALGGGAPRHAAQGQRRSDAGVPAQVLRSPRGPLDAPAAQSRADAVEGTRAGDAAPSVTDDILAYFLDVEERDALARARAQGDDPDEEIARASSSELVSGGRAAAAPHAEQRAAPPATATFATPPAARPPTDPAGNLRPRPSSIAPGSGFALRPKGSNAGRIGPPSPLARPPTPPRRSLALEAIPQSPSGPEAPSRHEAASARSSTSGRSGRAEQGSSDDASLDEPFAADLDAPHAVSGLSVSGPRARTAQPSPLPSPASAVHVAPLRLLRSPRQVRPSSAGPSHLLFGLARQPGTAEGAGVGEDDQELLHRLFSAQSAGTESLAEAQATAIFLGSAGRPEAREACLRLLRALDTHDFDTAASAVKMLRPALEANADFPTLQQRVAAIPGYVNLVAALADHGDEALPGEGLRALLAVRLSAEESAAQFEDAVLGRWQERDFVRLQGLMFLLRASSPSVDLPAPWTESNPVLEVFGAWHPRWARLDAAAALLRRLDRACAAGLPADPRLVGARALLMQFVALEGPACQLCLTGPNPHVDGVQVVQPLGAAPVLRGAAEQLTAALAQADELRGSPVVAQLSLLDVQDVRVCLGAADPRVVQQFLRTMPALLAEVPHHVTLEACVAPFIAAGAATTLEGALAAL